MLLAIANINDKFGSQRNVMDQNTEMSSLVSMLFQTFLNPLKFLIGGGGAFGNIVTLSSLK